MRAIIRQTAPNEVEVIDEDVFGEPRHRTFFVPNNGGYVRDRKTGAQICVGLGIRGNTLYVERPEDLLPLIRHERRRELRAERDL